MTASSSDFRKLGDAPAKSINVTGNGKGGKGDEAELYQHPGILSRVDGNEICAIIEVGEQKIIVATQNYSLGKEIDKGELFLYSVVNGVIKSSILLNKNGELIINDGTDNAIRYSEYNNDIQNILSQIQTELGKIATGISGAGGSYLPGTLSRDTSASRVDEVKLP